MAVRLIATKAQRYGTKWIKVGDAFSATRDDARVLKALGRAKDPVNIPAPSPALKPEKKTRRYRTEAMVAEPVAPEPMPAPVTEWMPAPTAVFEPAQTPIEPASGDESDESETRKKRWYKRRDLTAEPE